jgi:hypothetical protein
MKEYECVLDYTRGEARHPLNKELILRFRDPDTFEGIKAKVIIRPSFEGYPNLVRVYYVSSTKGREAEAVPVQIIEFIEEEVEEVKVLSKQKLSLGERRGTMLSDMIKERKEKKK